MLNVSKVGFNIMNTPINPITIVSHLLIPTSWFKKIFEKIVKKKGLVKNSAIATANGKTAKPI